MTVQREMTLGEWVNKLPRPHSARVEYAHLLSNQKNTSRDFLALALSFLFSGVIVFAAIHVLQQ